MKYDNESLDTKVGFIEDVHKYVLKEDLDFDFTSVTTVLKNYYEEFDSEGISEAQVKKKSSKYFGRDPKEVVREWEDYAAIKSAEGTALHLYGECLLDKRAVVPPDLPKAKWVPGVVQGILDAGYEMAKTELLVYSEELHLAGQSDIILKKKVGEDEYDYMIYDWKFLSKPLEKKSYYNPYKRNYKKMLGPFKYLMDCNWIHYSVQLAMYQTLTGDPFKIKEKVLVIVYDDGPDLVPCYPMRVFWDEDNELQAVYELWNGKFYDSRTDTMHKKWPKDIKGR